MSRLTKIWLVTAASLILIGCMLFGGVMTMLKWDFTKLSTHKYETNSYDINEGFESISVNTDTADISFVPSENSVCSVVCFERKKLKHSVTVKDRTLVIEVVDTRKWYEYIGISFRKPKITVYLPSEEYGFISAKTDTGEINIPSDFKLKSIDASTSTGRITSCASASESVKIKATTGSVSVFGAYAGSLDISVSTGKITVTDVTCLGDFSVKVSTGDSALTNITCKNLTSDGNTGDVSLNKVIIAEKLTVKRSTGDVKLDGSDAAEIFIETDTGDVRGSLLTEKVFIVNTATGKKEVPNTGTGGRCEITTDTGNIKITVG